MPQNFNQETEYDLLIIGGGVTGSAIAREAAKFRLRILLAEREPDVAEGISKANSGVLHAGFNVKPGSLKAKFNIEGLKLCRVIAGELGVEHSFCGKIVVGLEDSDLPYLENLLKQGRANGCTGLSIIGKDRIKELEPGVSGKWALLSESTGIISPFQFTVAMAENAVLNGAELRLNTECTSISAVNGGGFRVTFRDGTHAGCRYLINAAGMDAAFVKSLLEEHSVKTWPCRGEYYITDKAVGDLIKMAVYPVPPADGSGLGVHLTPTCNGNILIGPSADYIENGNDTANTAEVMKQLKTEAEQLLPGLAGASYIKNYAGIRPKLFAPGSGKSFEDFIIEESSDYPGMINLVGIESPGLTSAPAIAAYIINEIIGEKERLRPNPQFSPERRAIPRTLHMDSAEAARLAERDPNYSDIICRCEQVSRAEIIRAIHNPLGALSLNAIKKRTYSMMGRCQSGFCLPRILDIICEETGLQPEQIIKSSPGSEVVAGRLP